MQKTYKIIHLEFTRRDPHRRNRRVPSRRTRIRIGGRLLKPGTHMRITESFLKKNKESIDSYVKAGRIKLTGSKMAAPVKIEIPVLQDNIKKEVSVKSEAEPKKVEPPKVLEPPKVSVKKETPKKPEPVKVKAVKKPAPPPKPEVKEKKPLGSRSAERRRKKFTGDK